jgi:hypothetical protein
MRHTTISKHIRTLLVCTIALTIGIMFAVTVSADNAEKPEQAKKAQIPVPMDQFIAGTYRGARKKTYLLQGPADIGGGRIGWSLMCTDCAVTMSWTTGSPEGHPDLFGREIEGQLSPGYSYGIMGQNYPGSDFYSQYFRNGTLIGARQMGNSVTVYSFYNKKKRTDTRSPTSSTTITFTLEK